jgi:hypothetical protein
LTDDNDCLGIGNGAFGFGARVVVGRSPRRQTVRIARGDVELKVLRSRSAVRRDPRERLYVIESPTFSGTWVYTKGTIHHKARREVFYVFVSAKLAN